MRYARRDPEGKAIPTTAALPRLEPREHTARLPLERFLEKGPSDQVHAEFVRAIAVGSVEAGGESEESHPAEKRDDARRLAVAEAKEFGSKNGADEEDARARVGRAGGCPRASEHLAGKQYDGRDGKSDAHGPEQQEGYCQIRMQAEERGHGRRIAGATPPVNPDSAGVSVFIDHDESKPWAEKRKPSSVEGFLMNLLRSKFVGRQDWLPELNDARTHPIDTFRAWLLGPESRPMPVFHQRGAHE